MSELSAIYGTADLDRDGLPSEPEFLCAMALVARRRKGLPLVDQVPPELLKACWPEERPQIKVWKPNLEELKRWGDFF